MIISFCLVKIVYRIRLEIERVQNGRPATCGDERFNRRFVDWIIHRNQLVIVIKTFCTRIIEIDLNISNSEWYESLEFIANSSGKSTNKLKKTQKLSIYFCSNIQTLKVTAMILNHTSMFQVTQSLQCNK